MRRKYLVRAALALLAVLWLAFFAPRPMLKTADELAYGRCEYYSDEYPQGVYLDLTDEQAAEVLDILGQLWCFRVWGEDKHFLDDVVLEITLYDEREWSVYVVLGKRDYFYDGTRGPWQQFDIIGGDQATEQILALLGIDETRINGRREP